MSSQIDVIQQGYSRWEIRPTKMFANGTSTLVRSGQLNVIVDTLGPWDKHVIGDRLKCFNLTPDDINYVICTHSHPDHIGNLNLFTNCKHIVGHHVYKHDIYEFDLFDKNGQIQLSNDIKVISTPGHTMDDISLIVNNVDKLGTVGVVGDLFECENDLQDCNIWKEAGSENPDMQEKNRNMILKTVNYIVPGHGSMFNVKNK